MTRGTLICRRIDDRRDTDGGKPRPYSPRPPRRHPCGALSHAVQRLSSRLWAKTRTYTRTPYIQARGGIEHIYRGKGNIEMTGQDSIYFQGEALAHDRWAKNYGPWIVIGFVTIFALFLIGTNLA